jgi:hypothetical protein
MARENGGFIRRFHIVTGQTQGSVPTVYPCITQFSCRGGPPCPPCWKIFHWRIPNLIVNLSLDRQRGM